MALKGSRRASTPITFRPRGCTDSIDATNTPPGAMQSLSNLVQSPSTASMWVPRPAADLLTDFSTSGYTNPAIISCICVIGPRIYGMIGSDDFVGKDVPFCWDTSTGAFVAITGMLLANLPSTLSTTGDWQPPHMEPMNTRIMLTHTGFPGAAGPYFGWIDISNPAAPTWHSGNTATHALAAVPYWVSQFNGRAWYAVNNTVVFSDALDPLTVTNATQVLTLGDSTNVTCSAGLGLNSTTQGGIVQSLVVFKGNQPVWQITGDSATSNLLLNQIAGSVGSNSPNSVEPTPLGLAYVATDGLRIIDENGKCSNPIGANGDGISVPFVYALNPTRICAAFHHNTLAISCQNGASPTQAYQEWWLNLTTKSWSGPHTGAASLYQGFDGVAGTSAFGQDYIKVMQGVSHKLFSLAAIPLSNSVYTENGTALSWTWIPTLLPDNGEMSMNAEVETTVGLVLPPTISMTAIASNEGGSVLSQVTVTGPGTGPTVWNAFTWGAAVWGGVSGYFQQYQLLWDTPLVFKQYQVQLSSASVGGTAISNLYMRYQKLGYLLQNAS